MRMDNALFKDEKFNGKYVVIRDFSNSEIITSGDDPKAIYEEAQKKGIKEPLLIFVPNKNMVQIYFHLNAAD